MIEATVFWGIALGLLEHMRLLAGHATKARAPVLTFCYSMSNWA